MKFEQLLQIYWSKGFLFGGKVKSFNVNLYDFFFQMKGLGAKSKINFLKRFELTIFKVKFEKKFMAISLDRRKIINMYLSQLFSINNSIDELIKYNVIRLYLIKSFRGKAQSMGKPSHGQRTWSNASTAFKSNKALRMFIHEIKKSSIGRIKVESKNLKMFKKKIKKTPIRFKIKEAKQKVNAWF